MGLSLWVGRLADERRVEPKFLPEALKRIEPLRAALWRMGLRSKSDDQTTRTFKTLRECLVAAGVTSYVEPSELPAEASLSYQMWGYSGLHHLRRLAAYQALNRPLYEPAHELPTEEDPVVLEYYSVVGNGDVSDLPFQHLMLHGDSEGFYVPADFQRVIAPDQRHFKIVGGGIGSARRLLAECEALADILQLPLSLDPESEEIWEAADHPGSGDVRWQHFGIESFSCIRLVHACNRSIETGAAVVFC